MERFDINLLNAYVGEKRLKVQAHPTEDLLIWNYTEVTQFKKLWDDVTLQCRGLVTDTAGNVVARSFNKFFNEDERPYEATPEFTVFAKVDGSLGILFYYRDAWILASRGSFTSPQAERGRKILDERYPELTANLDKELTYSFEIIYPENRIVVDYGDEEKLIFLAAFRRDGTEADDQRDVVRDSGVEIVAEYPSDSIQDLKGRDTENEEGYVVRFSNGTRIKIKFPRYIALHRVMSNITSGWILEQYATGMTFEEICGNLPDEFFKWAKIVWDNIDKAYRSLRESVEASYAEAMVGQDMTRGDFARKIIGLPYKNVMFALYDGKDPRQGLLKFIDPQRMEPASAVGGGGGLRKFGNTYAAAKPVCMLLYGISGSGKTTFAKRWVETHQNSIVVSKDALHEAFFVQSEPVKNKSQEKATRRKLTAALEANIVRDALLRGATVLVDATYLTPEQIKRVLSSVPANCDVRVRTFDVPLAECMGRLSSIGRQVRKQDLQQEREIFEANVENIQALVEAEQEKRTNRKRHLALPRCYVFDIDGTLAIAGKRNAFDESKVLLDTPNPDIVSLVKTLALHAAIHICTGRTEGCRADTETWLRENGIVYHTLHMRAIGDQRADFKVKEEMWSAIDEKHYIALMYDDRAQVVHHARTLGYTVAQVAYGEF